MNKLTLLGFFLIGGVSISVAQADCVFSEPIAVEVVEIGNMLSWSTSEENNNEIFTIEKSKDGIAFEKVGQVNGAGNSFEEKHYRYLDLAMGENKIFYRISFADEAGNKAFTPTFVVSREITNNFMITAMSSTLTDKIFSLTLRSELEGIMDYSVNDLTGNVQQSGSVDIINGVNVISINIENLSNRKYKMNLMMGEEVEEIVLQKVGANELPLVNYVVKEQKE